MSIAIAIVKLNKEDMARPLGRGGVGDFGGCGKEEIIHISNTTKTQVYQLQLFRCGAKILLLISTVLGGQLPKCCRLGEVYTTQHQHHYQPNHQYHRHHHHFHLQLNKNKITIFKVAPDEFHASQFL